MAKAFYMDVHVPAAVTEGLRRRDVNVLTSQEDGTQEATDLSLLQRATDLGRVRLVLTHDSLLWHDRVRRIRSKRHWQRTGQREPPPRNGRRRDSAAAPPTFPSTFQTSFEVCVPLWIDFLLSATSAAFLCV